MSSYSNNNLDDKIRYVSIEENVSVSDARIRRSLFDLLISYPKETLPEILEDVVSGFTTLNDFWSLEKIEDFKSTFFYNNDTLLSRIESSPSQVISDVSVWINAENKRDAAKSSGICQNLESSLDKFERVIGNIQIAVGAYGSITQKLSELGGFDEILGVGERAIENLIDSYVDKMRIKIESIQSTISDLGQAGDVVSGKLIKIRDEMENMASEESIAALKEKVSGQLTFTLDQFEDIRTEEMRHVLNRVCNISKSIAIPFDRKTARADDIVRYYASTKNSLTQSTRQTTQDAINAGAYRYSSSQISSRQAEISTKEKEYVENLPDGSYETDATPDEIAAIPAWNDGKGDNNFTFRGQWISKVGQEGWTRVDQRVKVKLVRLQKIFGKKLYINSAFRPQWYNASIKGSAKNSLHCKGYALDISWDGFSPTTKEEFIAIARRVGFGGIGRYGTFVHVDIGTVRSWNG